MVGFTNYIYKPVKVKSDSFKEEIKIKKKNDHKCLYL